jgi:Tol biopolymer transport system component
MNQKLSRIHLICLIAFASACSAPQRAAQTQLEPTRTLAPHATTQPAPEIEITSAPAPEQKPHETKTPIASCKKQKPIVPIANVVPSQNMGRIVYLTTEGNVVLADGDGSNAIDLTRDGFIDQSSRALRIYHYPAFSNDAKQIAFVKLDVAEGALTQTLQVIETKENATPVDLYSTNRFNIPYLDFSPNDKSIAFLTISAQAGFIRVVDAKGGEPTTFGEGAPTYWHWRNDSSAMVTHLGGRAETKNDAAYLGIVNAGVHAGDPSNAKPIKLSSLPGTFQSPHFSPSGQHILFVANTIITDELVLADDKGDVLCSLAQLSEGAFFAWSPNGKYVALIDTQAPVALPAPLRVFDLSSGEEKQLRDKASAFFWSPDGERLVVYSIVSARDAQQPSGNVNKLNAPAIQEQSALFKIEIVGASDGKRIQVTDTNLTADFLQYLQYFDQYSRAVSPWSPDGTRLVFTSFASPDASPEVNVATIDRSRGVVSIKQIADGTLAFWSPQ